MEINEIAYMNGEYISESGHFFIEREKLLDGYIDQAPINGNQGDSFVNWGKPLCMDIQTGTKTQ